MGASARAKVRFFLSTFYFLPPPAPFFGFAEKSWREALAVNHDRRMRPLAGAKRSEDWCWRSPGGQMVFVIRHNDTGHVNRYAYRKPKWKMSPSRHALAISTWPYRRRVKSLAFPKMKTKQIM
ncbi:MAG: hypothetical protein SVV80_10765, partial [Planctomycetota bacterium]|nr:hypothetical protein [Planctomycetota bacterium]